jgi:hypothetical protein
MRRQPAMHVFVKSVNVLIAKTKKIHPRPQRRSIAALRVIAEAPKY